MADLVVFYSLTGKSQETARGLAEAMGADLIEIIEVQPRVPGFSGYMSAMLDSLLKRKPSIKTTPQVGAGDRVILCGPIWAGRIAGPLRTWLSERGRNIGELVWVPVSGAGGEWRKATAEITALLGHPPSRVAPFASREVRKSEAAEKIKNLAAWFKAPTASA